MLGNSSSGIRESAFLGTPTVNIGSRQHGRQRGKNVVDVPYDRSEICKAVKGQIAHGRYDSDHVYGDGFAAEKIVGTLRTHEFRIQKTVAY
jgi:UDP-N-acetylglucosamine 2-epimerase